MGNKQQCTVCYNDAYSNRLIYHKIDKNKGKLHNTICKILMITEKEEYIFHKNVKDDIICIKCIKNNDYLICSNCNKYTNTDYYYTSHNDNGFIDSMVCNNCFNRYQTHHYIKPTQES